MRVVFVGASRLSLAAARLLIERGHEVLIVDSNRDRIELLSDTIDCGFLLGDGSHPSVLREAGPHSTDVLFCVSDSDQGNLIASLVAKSLEFPKVVTQADDEEFEHIALELGLENVVIPARTIGSYLADIVEGRGRFELSSAFKGDAFVFTFVAAEDEGPAGELDLPHAARVTHLFREEEFVLVAPDTEIRKGDEVVVVAHRKHREELEKRWGNDSRD